MTPTPSPWMTRLAAGEYLSVCGETVTRWALKLKWRTVFDPAGHVRYFREDVEAALKETRPESNKRAYLRLKKCA